jgi:hypothetical protein
MPLKRRILGHGAQEVEGEDHGGATSEPPPDDRQHRLRARAQGLVGLLSAIGLPLVFCQHDLMCQITNKQFA